VLEEAHCLPNSASLDADSDRAAEHWPSRGKLINSESTAGL
jgi:hypothetical protein